MFLEKWQQYFDGFFKLDNQVGSKQLFGLEMNSDYLKVLKINTQQTPYLLEYFNLSKMPEGAIVKGEIKNPQVIAEILKENFKRDGIEPKEIEAAIAISRSSAIIKNIRIDSRLNRDEIESRVAVEADRLFPNLLKDIHLDFVITGPIAENPIELNVILIACRNSFILPYLEIGRLAGLRISVVDVSSYAIQRALNLASTQFDPQLKTVALLDITFSVMTLIVLSEGTLVYAYEVSYSSIKQEIRKQMAGSSKTPGSESVPETTTFQNTLLSHLRHTMQLFYSSRPNLRLEKILLAGGCVLEIPTLPSWIQNETGKEVIIVDPFKNMAYGQTVDQAQIHQYAPAFMLCCGLALSNDKLNNRSE